MIATWTIRNYAVTGEIVLLEKINHPESLDRMKPEFAAFWNFTKCWGEDGSKMNSYHIPFFNATLSGDTSEVYVDRIIDNIPQEIRAEIGEINIRKVIKQYRSVIYSQRVFFEKNIAMPKEYSPKELQVAEQFDALAATWKKNHLFSYYVINPVRYLKDMILHSNTSNLLIFQVPFRNEIPILNVYRLFLAAVHISFYIILFIGVFAFRYLDWSQYFVLMVLPITFILFFVLYIQAIEQRYMLPVLPAILVGNGIVIERLRLRLAGDN
ncbi:hypothetical protein WSM22_13650 [Cytophagales bacterium WSM2-2]|nr:hypothetical protein WSM22_13650 [Cytophagales bacterium WSM2-2]